MGALEALDTKLSGECPWVETEHAVPGSIAAITATHQKHEEKEHEMLGDHRSILERQMDTFFSDIRDSIASVKEDHVRHALSRNEFEGEIGRVWSAIDTHTHSLDQATGKVVIPALRMLPVSPTREASPTRVPVTSSVLQPMPAPIVLSGSTRASVFSPQLSPASLRVGGSLRLRSSSSTR